ncbi:MAG: glycosyltransferase family 9 protein [Rhodopila sp.]|nr:glycosyltransferase family 9 protein [Rhodopila sp.]
MTVSREGPPPYEQPVLVVQPLPGIGDTVWHLPHIRAIAAYAGAPVTLLTKPRSLADQLLVHEPAVADILWVDRNPSGRSGTHDGLTGFVRLVRMLRARRFGTAILLHKSDTLACATFLAGIPDRRGYGWGLQRMFLNTGPFLPRSIAKLRPHARATSYLRAAGIPLPSAEPTLTIPAATRLAARRRLGDLTSRFVVMGIGSSETLRKWSEERFAALAKALLDAGWPMIVLLGGPGDTAAAASIRATLGERVRLAMGWHLDEVAGLLAEAAFYAGNDTGVMNMAAAAGIRTYALFGTTPPIEHATQVVGITTPDIGMYDGVARITPALVLDVIRADRGTLSP